MSTRVSFGYHHGDDGQPAYHLFEDYHEPGRVFLELPREFLDELDSDSVTLSLPPELWERIRQHACPNAAPADFWETYKADFSWLLKKPDGESS